MCLVGMGLDSKHDFAPASVLLGLLLCPWEWGIFFWWDPTFSCRWLFHRELQVLAGEDEHTSFYSAILGFFLDGSGLLNSLSVQFSSVAQSCLTLCDPMSTPALPVHHQLPESTQTMSIELVIYPTILSSVVPFSSCPQSFPASGSFQMSQLFASGGQSIEVSASTSVLPMNTQD